VVHFNYDDLIPFVQTQVDKVEHDFSKTFEEVSDNIAEYHTKRCKAEGKDKEECLKEFMIVFTRILKSELYKRENARDLKGFGYIIKPMNTGR
jgi:hypothetical protein